MDGQPSDTQQRLLGVMLFVALDGPARLVDVANQFAVPAPTALRDLQQLQFAGLAQRQPDNTWAMGERLERLARRLAAVELSGIIRKWQ